MKKPKLGHNGFHVVELGIAFVILGVIGLVGFRVLGGKPKATEQPRESTAKTAKDTGPPMWEYNQNELKWFVKSGAAPTCPEALKLDMTPVDMSKIISTGLPGAYRGFSYKAHGGFRAAESTGGKVEVRLPMDAKLMSVGRYYERVPGGEYELQYILDFENDCGIAFRFDHIYTLTPAFQAYADKSPPPKKDDTRTDGTIAPIRQAFKAGEVIATEVGFVAAKNYGFDFGVYDLRQPNEISKNAAWAAIHKDFSAQHYHGICWLPLLPGADAAKAEAQAKDRNNYNMNKPFNLTSDYCTFAPHRTLDFNNGQPVDG